MSNTGWLELQKDEVLVREFSFQKANAIVVLIFIGLVVFAGLGVFYFYRASSANADLPWLIITNASMIVIVALVLAFKLSGNKNAVLTNKNLLVKTGRGVAALPLEQITGFRLGIGLARKKLFIYAGGESPAVTLVSEEPEEMLEEIAAACIVAGAQIGK